MSQASFDSCPALDAAPLRSIVAAWAVAIILLTVGELFVSFHNPIELPVSNAPVSQVQRAAAEDVLAW
jgi:hypothetical protein